MTFTVIAIWRAKAGAEDRIRDTLRTMTELSRTEEGCVHYQAHISTTDSTTFMLYEQYVDSRAYDAHKATQHFLENVVEYALHHLEERTVTTFEAIGES